MSTFDSLITDLTRDARRAQPKDALQFCANWFQTRLEEQRARSRDIFAHRTDLTDIPAELYTDEPLTGRRSTSPYISTPVPSISAIPPRRPPNRASIAHGSPFGTLNVPGNALLHVDPPPIPTFRVNHEGPPTSPLSSNLSPFTRWESITPNDLGPSLYPPNSAIFQRRSSVSAESIDVDAEPDEPPPFFPKTPEQIDCIKSIIKKLFIFRGLAEEQEKAAIGAMQERFIKKGEILIRQGDGGDAFYVIQSGTLHCFIRDQVPPTWANQTPEQTLRTAEGKFAAPGFHPVFGRKVSDAPAGHYVGELALLYGHPRAASVIAAEDSHLWALDRMTFRTIVLRLAHKRRMMYESFLASVDLLSSLDKEQRSKIADALDREVFEDGVTVVKEGDIGDKFFFVELGEAVVTRQGKEIGRLRKGEYFGELSLLREEPRAASVSAAMRTDPEQPRLAVAVLDAAAFRRLLGPLKDIMERKAGEQYGYSRR